MQIPAPDADDITLVVFVLDVAMIDATPAARPFVGA
jgi:hypothetical protein